MTVVEPRLTLERRLLQEYPLVIACDEVGRGAGLGSRERCWLVKFG